MLGIGIGIQSTSTRLNAVGEPIPPDGFAFVVDSNGNRVTDQNGNYVITEAA